MFAAQDADAQRGIRVDIGSGQFDLRGESWNEGTVQENFNLPGYPGYLEVILPFKLNFSGEAGRLALPQALLGFSWLNLGKDCGAPDQFACGEYAYTHPWLSNGGSEFKTTTKVGAIDRAKDANGEYNLAEALPAVQFRWYGRDGSNRPFDYQMILLDLSGETGNEGDFDVEVNFGYGQFVAPTDGFQSLMFGPASQHLFTTTNAYTDFCFRSGSLTFNCVAVIDPPPPPDPVPEPSTIALLGLGLLAALRTCGGARRQRRGT